MSAKSTHLTSGNTIPAIEIEGLKKSYTLQKGKDGKGGTMEALKGVSLSIPQGEFISLLGPNGAGKTSLISIIAGLGLITEGSVKVHGSSLTTDADRAKSFIGLVPQELNFDIFAKVIDIVVDQAGYYGIPRSDAMVRAEKILKDLGLWDKRDQQSQALSGGMKRRLMIARALIHEPQVLLLDEPTAGVDVELRRGMWDFLRELNKSGTTILLTTHYLEEAEHLSSRVAIINKGEIIEEGSVKDLLAKLAFVTLYLDTVEVINEAVMQLLRGEPLTQEDDHTLKLTLKPGETMNDIFRKLSTVGVHVKNVRTTGSMLEEVFMQVIDGEKGTTDKKANA